MTETRCDRCNAVVEYADRSQVGVVDKDGRMYSVVEDCCPKCVTQLREFCRPLARPTTPTEE